MDTLKKFAKKLDGRDVFDTNWNIFTDEELEEAKRLGIVICYGYSDDLMEFEGAYRDEVDCFNGDTVYFNKNGLCKSTDEDAQTITALWYGKTDWDLLMGIPWSYSTDIPHATFMIYEGDEPYCEAIVFYLTGCRQAVISPNANEIFFAKTKENAILPSKEEENAGYDIYPCFEDDLFVIHPHKTVLVPTGVACALHPKWYFQIEERGSTGSKGIKKSAGVIDSGYRGEIFVAITNTNSEVLVISKASPKETSQLIKSILPAEYRECGYIIYPYEKAIAQLILHEVPVMKTKEIPYEDLLKIPSKRGTGKLGSSNA